MLVIGMLNGPYKIGDLVALSHVLSELDMAKFRNCIHGIVIGYGRSRKYSNYKIFWWPLNAIYFHKDSDICLLSRVWYNNED